MKGKIRELTDLEDFKKVYKVFSGPPYNEKYTEEELEEIFREYKQKGIAYGAYSEEKCMRINSTRKRKKRESTC